MEYEASQAECSVPWLSEVLVLFTVGLQLCQQLKDKVCITSQKQTFRALIDCDLQLILTNANPSNYQYLVVRSQSELEISDINISTKKDTLSSSAGFNR